MTKKFARLLLSLAGWKVDPKLPPETERCVMTAAPHTSNWDFFYARLAFLAMGIPVRYTIKHSLMRFPYNLVFGPLGGIAIDRRPRLETGERPSYVEQMVDIMNRFDRIAVLVTPEGTRSLRTQWKTGFYYVAKKAGVPICLGYLDYAKKEAGVGPVIYPGDDMERDMRRIMDFYAPITGKHPEKFSVDERFAD